MLSEKEMRHGRGDRDHHSVNSICKTKIHRQQYRRYSKHNVDEGNIHIDTDHPLEVIEITRRHHRPMQPQKLTDLKKSANADQKQRALEKEIGCEHMIVRDTEAEIMVAGRQTARRGPLLIRYQFRISEIKNFPARRLLF